MKKAIHLIKLLIHVIQQIDSMLPCICSVINESGTWAVRRVCHWDVLTTFWCHLLLNKCSRTWNLLVLYKKETKTISYWCHLCLSTHISKKKNQQSKCKNNLKCYIKTQCTYNIACYWLKYPFCLTTTLVVEGGKGYFCDVWMA